MSDAIKVHLGDWRGQALDACLTIEAGLATPSGIHVTMGFDMAYALHQQLEQVLSEHYRRTHPTSLPDGAVVLPFDDAKEWAEMQDKMRDDGEGGFDDL